MTTSANGKIFRVTCPFWGNPPVTGGFPSQRPVTWSFDVFFALCLNKRLSKQSRCRWFKMPPCSLWRHCNDHCWRLWKLSVELTPASLVEDMAVTSPTNYLNETSCLLVIAYINLQKNTFLFTTCKNALLYPRSTKGGMGVYWIHPDVCPSVRPSVDKVSGTFLKKL